MCDGEGQWAVCVCLPWYFVVYVYYKAQCEGHQRHPELNRVIEKSVSHFGDLKFFSVCP